MPTLKSTALATLSLLAAIAVPVAHAQVVATFGFSGSEGNATFQETSNGVTATFSNPTAPDGSPRATFNSGYFSGTNYSELGGFQFSLDRDAYVTGYQVGYVNGNTAGATFFLFSGPPGAASYNNDFSTTGTLSINGSFFLSAGEVATFVSTFPDAAGFSQLQSLTVSAVPEPSTYALFAGAAGLIFVVVRRRRAALAA